MIPARGAASSAATWRSRSSTAFTTAASPRGGGATAGTAVTPVSERGLVMPLVVLLLLTLFTAVALPAAAVGISRALRESGGGHGTVTADVALAIASAAGGAGSGGGSEQAARLAVPSASSPSRPGKKTPKLLRRPSSSLPAASSSAAASLTCAVCARKGCGCNTAPDPDETRCICRGATAPRQQALGPGDEASRVDADIGRRRARVSERHNENVKLFALALQIVKKKETAGLVEAEGEVKALAKAKTDPTSSDNGAPATADALKKEEGVLAEEEDRLKAAQRRLADVSKAASAAKSSSGAPSSSGASGGATGSGDGAGGDGAGGVGPGDGPPDGIGVAVVNPCDTARLRAAAAGGGSGVDGGAGDVRRFADCVGRFPNGTIAHRGGNDNNGGGDDAAAAAAGGAHALPQALNISDLKTP